MHKTTVDMTSRVALPLKPSVSASLHSKASDLEEELKNVTNNLKSLEAQSEKVRVHTCLYKYHFFLCLLRGADQKSFSI